MRKWTPWGSCSNPSWGRAINIEHLYDDMWRLWRLRSGFWLATALLPVARQVYLHMYIVHWRGIKGCSGTSLQGKRHAANKAQDGLTDTAEPGGGGRRESGVESRESRVESRESPTLAFEHGPRLFGSQKGQPKRSAEKVTDSQH
ncbi:hypothetical protein E4U54_003084 [Claviceps lovelessii]|nr:hypothetical protein E4U54_003084 [Claviceps lovelessii]